MTASGGMGPLRAALSLCCLLARLYVLAIARISAALPELPLRRLHGCLNAFENHRILERH